MSWLIIELQAHAGNPDAATRTFEAFGRAAAGLALEGIYVRIDASPADASPADASSGEDEDD